MKRGLGDMTTARITKRLVDRLEPKQRRFVIFDTELKGFGVRVTPTGNASYIVEYRPSGGGRNTAKKRMNIGRVGEITPHQARNIARDKLTDVRKGNDPLADRQTKRREIRLTELIEYWERESPPGKRTGRPMTERTRAYTLARLRHHVVPILGKKRVSEVTVEDINDMIRRVSAGETKRDEKSPNKRGRIRVRGGLGAARKVSSDLSIIFGYAVERGIVSQNPVSGARKPPQGKRHEFLSSEDIGKLADALSAMEAEGVNPSGISILRLLILTGARPAEIEGLRWSEVDIKGGCLRLARSKTGSSIRPVPPQAVELIAAQPRFADVPYVFPATRGAGHFRGSKKLWNKARQQAGLPDRVRYHARHAVASMAISEGIDLASVAAIMGHKSPRTTLAVYAHVLDDRAHQGAAKIGAKIAAAMAAKEKVESSKT